MQPAEYQTPELVQPMLFTIVAAAQPFVLPTAAHGTYQGVVDWGDGSPPQTITAWDENTTHTYADPGRYQISLSGSFSHLDYRTNAAARPSAEMLVSIDRWGDLLCGSFANAFRDASNLLSCPVALAGAGVPGLRGATDMSEMFLGCENLEVFDPAAIDASTVTDISGMFRRCGLLTELDLSSWDVSQVVAAADFLRGVTLSTRVYDSVLNAWAKQEVQPGIHVNFGRSKYINGAAARAVLTGAPNNWVIEDGGYGGR